MVRHKRHGERRGTRGKPRPKANPTAASLRRSFQQVLRGEVRPVSELWEGLSFADVVKVGNAFGVAADDIAAALERVARR